MAEIKTHLQTTHDMLADDISVQEQIVNEMMSKMERENDKLLRMESSLDDIQRAIRAEEHIIEEISKGNDV